MTPFCSDPDCESCNPKIKPDWEIIDELQSTLTSAQEENKRLLSALISMCEQYIQNEDGKLFHMFMGAGEEATEVLEDMGYLTSDAHENYSWTNKALNGKSTIQSLFEEKQAHEEDMDFINKINGD